jgi:hypothetical protein
MNNVKETAGRHQGERGREKESEGEGKEKEMGEERYSSTIEHRKFQVDCGSVNTVLEN